MPNCELSYEFPPDVNITCGKKVPLTSIEVCDYHIVGMKRSQMIKNNLEKSKACFVAMDRDEVVDMDY